ncbi:hypothetical protein V6N13_083572 [Hibiscus sabdariffa]
MWRRTHEAESIKLSLFLRICIIEKIQGSLRNDLLTITMPKRTVTQLPQDVNLPKQITDPIPKPYVIEKQVDLKLKSVPKPKAQPKPMAMMPPKLICEPKSLVTTTVPKPISEPKPLATTMENPIDEFKPPMATAPQIPKEKNIGKEVEALLPSKQQEEIQRKVSPIAKQTGEEKGGGSMPTTPEIVKKKGETTYVLKD